MTRIDSVNQVKNAILKIPNLLKGRLYMFSSYSGIWTEVMPLGWYVVDILTSTHGSNWPAAKCQEWAGSASTAAPELPCPCNVQQAQADTGRFRQEVACGDGNMQCILGLSDCYLSIQPT